MKLRTSLRTTSSISIACSGTILATAFLAYTAVGHASEASGVASVTSGAHTNVYAPAAQDSTEGVPIRTIAIVTHNIFDPPPASGPRPLYELADRLHIRTRERTIRSQLLFATGDVWSDSRAQESERALRALHFVEPVRLDALREDDSVDVVVETRDAWSTIPEITLVGTGGKVFGSFSLIERNLLGLGKLLSGSYRQEPHRIVRAGGFEDPNVFGSRLQLSASAGTQSDGAALALQFGLPFYAQDTHHSYESRWNRATSVAHLYQDGSEVAEFDRRVEEVRVTVGRGFRKGPAILREEGSFVVLDRRFGPSRLAPDAPPEFEGGEENLHLRRFEGTVQLWRPRYVTKKGIDRLDGIEDIDLGSSARATVGWAPRVLGGTEEEGYAGADLVRGATMGARSFGLIRGSVSTRLKQEPLETQLRAEARLVDQTLPRQTVVFAATTTAGIRAPRDFQVILGGLSGLRAYPIEALSGESGLRLNFEDRVVLAREILQVVSLGLVAFYDAGRVWGVGSQGRAWIQDAGTGLRISLSRSSHKRVLRADVAWPISPTRDGRGGPVISFGSEQAF